MYQQNRPSLVKIMACHPDLCQATISATAGLLLIGSFGTNFSEVWSEIMTTVVLYENEFESVVCRIHQPFCLRFNELIVSLDEFWCGCQVRYSWQWLWTHICIEQLRQCQWSRKQIVVWIYGCGLFVAWRQKPLYHRRYGYNAPSDTVVSACVAENTYQLNKGSILTLGLTKAF